MKKLLLISSLVAAAGTLSAFADEPTYAGTIYTFYSNVSGKGLASASYLTGVDTTSTTKTYETLVSYVAEDTTTTPTTEAYRPTTEFFIDNTGTSASLNTLRFIASSTALTNSSDPTTTVTTSSVGTINLNVANLALGGLIVDSGLANTWKLVNNDNSDDYANVYLGSSASTFVGTIGSNFELCPSSGSGQYWKGYIHFYGKQEWTLASGVTLSLSGNWRVDSGAEVTFSGGTLVTATGSAGTDALVNGKITVTGTTLALFKLSGTGTIDLGSTGSLASGQTPFSFTANSDTQTGWQGTIILSDRTGTGGINLNSYGIAGSTIQLSGISNYLQEENAGSVAANIHLVNSSTAGYALKLTNGWAGKTMTFSGKITGDGTFYWAKDLNQSFVFSGNLSEFEGKFTSVDGTAKTSTVGTLTFGNRSAGVLSADKTSVTGTGAIHWGGAFALNYTGVDGATAGTAVNVGNSSIIAKSVTFGGGANYSVTNSVTGYSDTATDNSLTISAGTTTFNGAVLKFGTITVDGNAVFNGTVSDVSTLTATGTISVGSTGSLDLSGAAVTIASAIKNAGTVTVDASTTLFTVFKVGDVITGTIDGSGAVTAATFGGVHDDFKFSATSSGISITSLGTVQTLTWNTNTAATWDAGSTGTENWADASGNAAKFYHGDSVKISGTNTGTITLGSNVSAGTITVDASATTTIATSSTVNSVTTSYTLAAAKVDSSSAVTTQGSGTVVIDELNVESGRFTLTNKGGISLGTVVVSSGGELRFGQFATTGAADKVSSSKFDVNTDAKIFIEDGGKLTFNIGDTLEAPKTYNGGEIYVKSGGELRNVDGNLVIGANTHIHFGVSADYDGTGDISYDSSATATFSQYWQKTINFEGIISGAGTVTLQAPEAEAEAFYRISGTQNDFTGTYALSSTKQSETVTNKAYLVLLSENAAATASVSLGSDTFLRLGAEKVTIAGLSGTAGTVELVNNVTSSTLTINQSADSTFAGTITGAVSIEKTNSGTLTLSGGNSYTGTTTVSGGVLNLSGTNTLANTVTVKDGATLNITGGTTTVSGGVTITGTDSSATSHLYVKSGAKLVDSNEGGEKLGITLSGSSNMQIESGATLEVASTSGNRWALNFNSIAFASGSNLKFSGSCNFVFAQQTFLIAPTIQVESGATLENYGDLGFSYTTTIKGTGTFKVNGGSENKDTDGKTIIPGSVIFYAGGSIETATLGYDSSAIGTLDVRGGTLSITADMSGYGAKISVGNSNGTTTKLQISSEIGGADITNTAGDVTGKVTAAEVTFAAGAQLLLTKNWLNEPSGTAEGTSTIDEKVLTIICSSAIYYNDVQMTSDNVQSLAESFIVLDDAFIKYTSQVWSYANDTLTLTLAIPEPSMFGLLAGTLALALAGTRRRRRGNVK